MLESSEVDIVSKASAAIYRFSEKCKNACFLLCFLSSPKFKLIVISTKACVKYNFEWMQHFNQLLRYRFSFNFSTWCVSAILVLKIVKYYWLAWSRGLRCITLLNFIKIVQSLQKYCNFLFFQDGACGHSPFWICLGPFGPPAESS